MYFKISSSSFLNVLMELWLEFHWIYRKLASLCIIFLFMNKIDFLDLYLVSWLIENSTPSRGEKVRSDLSYQLLGLIRKLVIKITWCRAEIHNLNIDQHRPGVPETDFLICHDRPVVKRGTIPYVDLKKIVVHVEKMQLIPTSHCTNNELTWIPNLHVRNKAEVLIENKWILL